MNRAFYTPTVIGIASVLLYVLVYCGNLWGLTHYQFFPLLLAAVGYLGYQRYGGAYVGNWCNRLLRYCAFLGGVAVAVAATVFASPWMAYLAFALFVAAWLLGQRDAEVGGSLGYLSLPLFLIWQPPYSPYVTGDGILISKLQRVSAGFASHSLDLLGVKHVCPGTVIHCAGQSFGVEEACSGVQSFFLLLSVAALLGAFNRRTILHTAILVTSGVYWAVVVNTLRISLIPLAYSWFHVDLSHGVQHTVLGLTTMAIGVAMVLSTDYLVVALSQLLGFAAKGESTDQQKPVASARQATPVWQWATVPVLVLACGLQVYDIASSWNQQKSEIDFFSSDVLVDLFESDGPATLGQKPKVDYLHQNRVRGADFGERSDIWFYGAPGDSQLLSLDQAFPGWHELTVCYTNQGWKLDSRRVVELDSDWHMVETHFSKPNGQYGYLIFSMFNQSGQPVRPPSDWGSLNALRERIKGRLTPAVRGTLFSLAAYQVQLFEQRREPFDEQYTAQLMSEFQVARDHIRQSTLARMKR